MPSIIVFHSDAEPIRTREPDGFLHVEQHPISEVTDFDVIGQPEPGVAYVRHPVSPRRLLPLATYHPTLLVEKANEAALMMTYLGASHIELSCTSRLCDQARAEIEILFGLVTLGGNKDTNEEGVVLYRAQGEGSAPRTLPTLTWIKEPTWEAIVQGRLHSGLRECSTSFTYDHSSGVDADLAAKVKRCGFTLGGEYRKSHRIAFNLSGTFPASVPTSAAA